MIKEIRLKLIEIARQQTTWTYSTLNEQLMLGLSFKNDYDRNLIGEWLGEISEHEFNCNRPLLSCLITHKNGLREQGDGFYKLCERLYGDQEWQSLKANKKWEKGLIAECYEYWLNPINYKNFKNDF
jgi:hypothetical protein